jgi:hypothetical protein
MKNMLLASVAFVFVAATTSFAAAPVENRATPTVKPIYSGLQMLADNNGDGGGGNDDGADHDSNDDHGGGGNDDGADHDSNDDHGGTAAGNDEHDAEDGDDEGAVKRVKKPKSLMRKKIKSNG